MGGVIHARHMLSKNTSRNLGRIGSVTHVLKIIFRILNIRLTRRQKFWNGLGDLFKTQEIIDLSTLIGGSNGLGPIWDKEKFKIHKQRDHSKSAN